ncbi:MAG TPA: hypothetical protein VF785_15290 [Gemmatimonadaceae bacterium]
MLRHTMFLPIVALVVAGHVVTGRVAAAQTLSTSTPQLSPYVPPTATTSFTAYAAFGTLGSAPIDLNLIGVNFGADARLDGKVLFVMNQRSTAYLFSPVTLPNGNYSAQFVFTTANQPTTFTITRGTSTVLATCPMAVFYTITQTCSSGVFAVADGKLDLTLAMTQGYQATLAKVVVNQWK